VCHNATSIDDEDAGMIVIDDAAERDVQKE